MKIMTKTGVSAVDRTAALRAELEMLEQIEEVNELDFPDYRTSKDGKITGFKDTEANGDVLFEHYDVKIAYNEMTKETEIDIPTNVFGEDTKANAQLAWLKARARQHNMPDSSISDYIELKASKNTYHPVRNWISSKEWDGVDRMPSWLATVQSDNVLKGTLMEKWALSAVAAMYERDFSTEGVLIFIGRQGIGKTRWLTSLVPNKKWVKDGVLLDPKNKDSVLLAVSAWISELGELPSTFRKADIDQLKAFITLSVDNVRPAYAPKANSYKRQTVFFGTSNDVAILSDDENRRFWPIQVTHINIDHGIDMQQFWAQVKVMHDAGAERFLTSTERERLYEVQESKHRHVSPVEERLATHLVIEGKLTKSAGRMNTTAILIKLGLSNPNQKDKNVASRWLEKNGYDQDSRRCWLVELTGLDD